MAQVSGVTLVYTALNQWFIICSLWALYVVYEGCPVASCAMENVIYVVDFAACGLTYFLMISSAVALIWLADALRSLVACGWLVVSFA